MITRKKTLPGLSWLGNAQTRRQPNIDDRLDDHDALTVQAIIECGIRSFYQPILDLACNDVLGYECLSRGPDGHVLEPPKELFTEAREHNLLPPLETTCRRLAVARFAQRDLSGRLFLNCEPHAFLHPEYPQGYTRDQLDAAGMKPENVVIELTACYFREDYWALRKACKHYRSMGFGIAIADLGTSYSGLRLWSELEPDYVKLDPHFARDVDRSRVKQSFIKALVQISDDLRTRLIVTGIETAAEAEVLRDLEVQLMQGYFFALPSEHPTYTPPEAAGLSPRRRAEDLQVAGELAHWVEPVSPADNLESLWQRLERDVQCQVLPVVHSGVPLGLIERARVYELLAKPHGRKLFSRHSAERFLAPKSLMVYQNTLVSDLSRMVTDDSEQQVRQHFIVRDEHGGYLGVGNARDLLRHMTEHRLRIARHANPLTHLPGNVPTNEHLRDLVRQKASFSVAYIDIDAFKPFNDTWGYQLGDQVILALAALLRERLRSRRFFIGHIGGDDFVVVSTHHNPEPQLRLMQTLFAERIKTMMASSGRPTGSYQAADRHGIEREYALPRVSVGIVHITSEYPSSLDDLNPALGSAKRGAKQLGGQGLFSQTWPDS